MSTLLLGLAFLWVLLGMAAVGYGVGRHHGLEDARKELAMTDGGGSTVECSVCGDQIGRGPSGMGLAQHAATHRREFEDLTGRQPTDYDEVREFFATEGRQPTLHEAALDEDQTGLLGGRDER